MKPALKEIALERMRILARNAASNARLDPALAQQQALLVRRISTRYRIPLPRDLRMLFCKRCKSFMAPGIGSRIRLGRSSIRAVRVTCEFCCHTYHKILPP